MLSQILGLNNDRLVNAFTLRFLVKMDSIEENQVPQIQVTEFLAKAMHT